MPTILGWQNIYASGDFHRQGKPTAFDRHGGDIYPSKEAALNDIDIRARYVTTCAVTWDEDEFVVPNPADSVPTPLSKTRFTRNVGVPDADASTHHPGA